MMKSASILIWKKNSKILGYIYIGTPSIEPKQIPDLDIDDFVTRWE